MPRASLHSLLAIGQRCKTLLDDRTGCFSTQPIRRPRLQAGGAALYGEPSVADGNDGWNMMSLVLRVPSDEMFAAALEVTVRFWFALVVFGIVLSGLSGCATGASEGQVREIRARWFAYEVTAAPVSSCTSEHWEALRREAEGDLRWTATVADLERIERDLRAVFEVSRPRASGVEHDAARESLSRFVRDVKFEISGQARLPDDSEVRPIGGW